jgi:hypothetical protein
MAELLLFLLYLMIDGFEKRGASVEQNTFLNRTYYYVICSLSLVWEFFIKPGIKFRADVCVFDKIISPSPIVLLLFRGDCFHGYWISPLLFVSKRINMSQTFIIKTML